MDPNTPNFCPPKQWTFPRSFSDLFVLRPIWDTYLRWVPGGFPCSQVRVWIPSTCWLCEDKTWTWQALVPLHLDLAALLLPEELLCGGQKQTHAGKCLFWAITSRIVPWRVAAMRHRGSILPFIKADYKIPCTQAALHEFFSATCQKASLAFHIALVKFSLIQSEQHCWSDHNALAVYYLL